jgi:hypothetical protein
MHPANHKSGFILACFTGFGPAFRAGTVEGHFLHAEIVGRPSRSLFPVLQYPIYKGHFPMKTFTLDEAQSLLPVLESLLKRAMEGKQSAEEVETGLSELARRIYLSGGMRIDVTKIAKQRAEMESHLQKVRETIAEIDSIGVQVKDFDAGLLDFPCRLEDQVVLLCWRMGEPTIEHWHTVESGYQGRQPVDDRFRRRSNSGGRPN